jgi:hypothetical protein
LLRVVRIDFAKGRDTLASPLLYPLKKEVAEVGRDLMLPEEGRDLLASTLAPPVLYPLKKDVAEVGLDLMLPPSPPLS